VFEAAAASADRRTIGAHMGGAGHDTAAPAALPRPKVPEVA